MPPQTISKTAFLNKLKTRTKGGFESAKSVTPQAKGARIPGGINGGVAKCIGFSADVDKKGNPYFMLKMVVITPDEYHGIKGTKFYRLAESKDGKGVVAKTVQDKLDDFCSDLQLLGLETASLPSLDDLYEAVDDLGKNVQPVFQFNTWQPTPTKAQPDPQVNIFVQGQVSNPGDYEIDDAAVSPPENNGEAEPEDTTEDDTPEDTSAEDTASEPEKGEIYLYKSATGPRAKAEDHEVIKVNSDNQQVDLRRRSDQKVFKGVGWEKLERAE